MVSLASFADELTKLAVSPLAKEMAKATLWGMGFESLLNRDATPLGVVREGLGFGIGDVGATALARGLGYGRAGQFAAGMLGGNVLASALRRRFADKPVKHAIDKLPDTAEFKAIKQAGVIGDSAAGLLHGATSTPRMILGALDDVISTSHSLKALRSFSKEYQDPKEIADLLRARRAALGYIAGSAVPVAATIGLGYGLGKRRNQKAIKQAAALHPVTLKNLVGRSLVGAAIGGTGGALVDKDHRVRGALIGGTLGLGAGIGHGAVGIKREIESAKKAKAADDAFWKARELEHAQKIKGEFDEAVRDYSDKALRHNLFMQSVSPDVSAAPAHVRKRLSELYGGVVGIWKDLAHPTIDFGQRVDWSGINDLARERLKGMAPVRDLSPGHPTWNLEKALYDRAGLKAKRIVDDLLGREHTVKISAPYSTLTPQSSNVSGYNYDPATQSLNVTYKGGGTYTYKGVSAKHVKALKRNKSVGKTINKLIKPNYEYEKVGGVADLLIKARPGAVIGGITGAIAGGEDNRLKGALAGAGLGGLGLLAAKKAVNSMGARSLESAHAGYDYTGHHLGQARELFDRSVGAPPAERAALGSMLSAASIGHNMSSENLAAVRSLLKDLRIAAGGGAAIAGGIVGGKKMREKTAKQTAFGEDYYDESEDAGWKDKIPGGLADRKTPADFDPKALSKGMKVELEHVNDRAVAMEIAMDHLAEDKDYYDKLEKMEKSSSLSSTALRALVRNPVQIGALTGAGAGALSAGEGNRTKGALTGGAIGAGAGKLGDMIRRSVAQKVLTNKLVDAGRRFEDEYTTIRSRHGNHRVGTPKLSDDEAEALYRRYGGTDDSWSVHPDMPRTWELTDSRPVLFDRMTEKSKRNAVMDAMGKLGLQPPAGEFSESALEKGLKDRGTIRAQKNVIDFLLERTNLEKKSAPRSVMDEVLEALRIREIKRRAGTLRDIPASSMVRRATPPPIPRAALKRRGNVLAPVSGEIAAKPMKKSAGFLRKNRSEAEEERLQSEKMRGYGAGAAGGLGALGLHGALIPMMSSSGEESLAESVRRTAAKAREMGLPADPSSIKIHRSDPAFAGTIDRGGKPVAPILHLPSKPARESVLAHELGHYASHLKSSPLYKKIQNASRLATGGIGGRLAAGALAGELAQEMDNPSYVPAALGAAVAAPVLYEEAVATGHAFKNMMKQHGALRGGARTLNMLPAFASYLAPVAIPAVVTAARKAYREKHPVLEKEAAVVKESEDYTTPTPRGRMIKGASSIVDTFHQRRRSMEKSAGVAKNSAR